MKGREFEKNLPCKRNVTRNCVSSFEKWTAYVRYRISVDFRVPFIIRWMLFFLGKEISFSVFVSAVPSSKMTQRRWRAFIFFFALFSLLKLYAMPSIDDQINNVTLCLFPAAFYRFSSEWIVSRVVPEDAFHLFRRVEIRKKSKREGTNCNKKTREFMMQIKNLMKALPRWIMGECFCDTFNVCFISSRSRGLDKRSQFDSQSSMPWWPVNYNNRKICEIVAEIFPLRIISRALPLPNLPASAVGKLKKGRSD